MPLDIEQVQRLAVLARIELTGPESERVRTELNGIFSLIEAMQAVDTRGIEPMAHGQAVTARMREDRVTESDQRTAFQAVAPQVEAGLYLVPKVIE